MFRDLLEVLQEFLKKLVTSRLFALSVIFVCLFAGMIGKLFDMQIVNGEAAQKQFTQETLKTIYTPGSRGNILDRNGNILAYNELAYSVTIEGNLNAYPGHAKKNNMLLKLIRILESHGETVTGSFEVEMDEQGAMYFTASSESAHKRFLRDFYGLTSVDKLTDRSGKYPADITAREAFEEKKTEYELDQMKDEKENAVILSDEETLRLINIRYTLNAKSYIQYLTTTIASDVSDETVADVSEHMAELQGVNIEESTKRIYNYAKYFAPIIGYTGKVQEDQLEELRKMDENYRATDIVGRIGIEAAMEYELQGKKGIEKVFVDNRGRIIGELDSTEPIAGRDMYLSLDLELHIGIYHLLEQQLAGVLTGALVNRDVTAEENKDSSKIKIPIKDAYYQLINNNVLSLEDMAAGDATEIEKQIHGKFLSSKEQILTDIRYQLTTADPVAMADLPEDMKAYLQYIYTYLYKNAGIVMLDKIDSNSSEAVAWKNESISLREYLYAGIANSWIDTTNLEINSKYSNADDSFQALVEFVMEALEDNKDFSKRIYRYLINQDVVSGKELCLALYAQGVLNYDEQQVNLLYANGSNYAYTFMIEKISNLEITPAQLALDPCTAGCTVINVKTGEVLAVVTYPSYDNNMLSGTVDANYYSKLNNDLSLPLYNNTTQVTKAPGSTFKPITAIAALEEGALSLTETIKCTGIYTDISMPIRCWIYPSAHKELDIIGGLGHSCNFFFAEAAHRLSTDENGVYSTERGLETIRKYATMFGLDHTTGIEIEEKSPTLSTEDPERSAMGQGNNAYTNTQLARYVTALANRGDVYDLTLLKKITNADGTEVENRQPEIANHVEVPDSTWDAVQSGMRAVVSTGSAKKIFADLEVDIAGKTGTAQENTRGNHGLFISYGPYADPEISVTVNIPYGYTASNAASAAKNVYKLYYGYTDLDFILNTGALDATNVVIYD